MEAQYRDCLTGLFNKKYIDEYVVEFMIHNTQSRIVMIDLQKFKNINDTLGHDVGDQCLKYFAKILQMVFAENDKNVLARLHGDEYCILTSLTENELIKRFELVRSNLEFAYVSSVIPTRILFNAGDAQLIYDYNKSKSIADYMMYQAKYENKSYQPYDKNIHTKKVEEEYFQSKLDTLINNSNINYSKRDIYTIDSDLSDYYQIYTKNENGSSLLGNGNYKSISGSILSQQLDLYNLNNCINNITSFDKKGILLLDCKTLLRYEDILKAFEKLSKEDKKKIILGLDLKKIYCREKKTLLKGIEELQNSNINILLDKVDDDLTDSVIEDTNIHLIRINNKFWKQAIYDKKKYIILKYKLRMLEELDPTAITLFDFIDNEEELKYLLDIINDNSLLSGNHFSVETKLTLSR